MGEFCDLAMISGLYCSRPCMPLTMFLYVLLKTLLVASQSEPARVWLWCARLAFLALGAVTLAACLEFDLTPAIAVTGFSLDSCSSLASLFYVKLWPR